MPSCRKRRRIAWGRPDNFIGDVSFGDSSVDVSVDNPQVSHSEGAATGEVAGDFVVLDLKEKLERYLNKTT